MRNHVRPGQRVCAALSGGVDSVVLLDCLTRLCRRLRFRLSAIHVNHGLSPNAGRWAGFCKRLCARRRVPLAIHAVSVGRRRGESLEAKARDARYAVLGEQPADFVALAHNRDDQAETLLLQLLRGAGLKGLAAMPVVRDQGSGDELRDSKDQRARGGARLLRPLLGVGRAEIEACGRARRLSWVEDESNASLRFDRNYLRRRVMPLLERRFPGCRQTLARASRHLGEALLLTEAVAAADAVPALDGDGIRVAVLRALGPARAKNLLRHLIGRRGASMPHDASLEEGLRQLLGAGRDARVAVRLGELVLRRQGNLAFLEWDLPEPSPDLALAWHGAPKLELGPGLGRLCFRSTRGKGLSARHLAAEDVIVRLRRGGERLQPDPGRPRRTLKNLLQESGLPHWRRQRLPLVFCGEELVWVPGIGVAAAFRCGPRERGVEISWEPGN